MRRIIGVFTLAGVLLFTACSSTPENNTKPITGDPNAALGDSQTQGLDPDADIRGQAISGLVPIPIDRIVYFAYDRSEIRPSDQTLLDNHARFLSANPALNVRLEGHADERGSREYNLALGERRALAVRQALLILGVPPQQITTLSYGEERPLSFGQNETAWSQNRRVEIVYPPNF